MSTPTILALEMEIKAAEEQLELKKNELKLRQRLADLRREQLALEEGMKAVEPEQDKSAVLELLKQLKENAEKSVQPACPFPHWPPYCTRPHADERPWKITPSYPWQNPGVIYCGGPTGSGSSFQGTTSANFGDPNGSSRTVIGVGAKSGSFLIASSIGVKDGRACLIKDGIVVGTIDDIGMVDPAPHDPQRSLGIPNS